MATDRPSSTPVPLPRLRALFPLLVGLVVVLSSCSGSDPESSAEGRPGSFHPDGWDGPATSPPSDLYDPVAAGEPVPDGSFRQVLARDDIAPVYDPRFVATADAGWEDEELIIGVDLGGEARAYPVRFLNRREIVVDVHRGIPTFVTW